MGEETCDSSKRKMNSRCESPPIWGSPQTLPPTLPPRPESPPIWKQPRMWDLPQDKRPAKCLEPDSPPVCASAQAWQLPQARRSSPPSPPVWESPEASASPRRPFGLPRPASPPVARLHLAPVRAAFRGAMGKLPPVPTSSVFIEDVLTGKAQAPALYPTFDRALFHDH